MRRLPATVCACVIGLMAIRTHAYASAWHSDLTLWREAVQVSRLKPRPWINYGAALVLAGHGTAGARAFQQARNVSYLPEVPPWDRRVAGVMTTQNLTTLAAMGITP